MYILMENQWISNYIDKWAWKGRRLDTGMSVCAYLWMDGNMAAGVGVWMGGTINR